MSLLREQAPEVLEECRVEVKFELVYKKRPVVEGD
jgi:hypothetical protein